MKTPVRIDGSWKVMEGHEGGGVGRWHWHGIPVRIDGSWKEESMCSCSPSARCTFRFAQRRTSASLIPNSPRKRSTSWRTRRRQSEEVMEGYARPWKAVAGRGWREMPGDGAPDA